MGHGKKRAFMHAWTTKVMARYRSNVFSEGFRTAKGHSFGQDIREMYSPKLLFTAFRRLKQYAEAYGANNMLLEHAFRRHIAMKEALFAVRASSGNTR